jgi:peptidoglycan-associated lipoprotein
MRLTSKKWYTVGLGLCLALAFAAGGCQKKTTKVEPTPEPAPAPVEEPRPAPSDEDVYKPMDMDSAARAVLLTIYFDYDQYKLRPEAIEQLERVAKFLSDNKSIRVLMEGHADERGTDEYNMGLGENRAKAAKQYLTTYGIDANRLETTSYGRERPATPSCPDEACHAKNRRVEWKVLSM